MNIEEMKVEREYHALVLFELDISVDLREAQLRRELDSDEGNIDYHNREVQILQGKPIVVCTENDIERSKKRRIKNRAARLSRTIYRSRKKHDRR